MLSIVKRKRTLHEATRRALCRLMFLLLAALPVGLTLAACIAQYVPYYRQARVSYFERQISLATGFIVQIGSVEPREPNKRLLHQVRLLEPETGQLIGNVQTVYLYQNNAGYAVHCTQTKIQGELLPTAYRLLNDNVLCRPMLGNQRIMAWMDGLCVVRTDESPVKFHQLRADLKRFAKQPNDASIVADRSTVCDLTFDLDEKAGGLEGKLTFTRDHDQPGPSSRISLNCGAQYVPLAWALLFSNIASPVNQKASFNGQYDLVIQPDGWSLRGSGRMFDLDATHWLERPVLTGSANVTIDSLSVNHRMLESISGELEMRDGRVHDDLIAAAHAIGIKPTTQQQSSEARWYKELALGFALNSQGLRLKSLRKQRAIVLDSIGPIAFQYADESFPVPINNLLIALTLATHPQSANNVAFSPAASRMNQWLPRPLASPPTDQSWHQVSN